jgi:hypothetical protein
MSRWPIHYRISVAIVGFVIVLFVGLILATRNRQFRLWMASEAVSEEQLIRQLGGRESMEVIRKPDRVEAVLLEPPDVKTVFDAAAYKVASDAISVPDNVAENIGRVLTTPHRQIPDPKTCIVRYGVRISYLAGANRSDIYFCFEWAILEVVFNGKSVGGMNFEMIYDQLIAEALKIYPNHQGLAQLAKDWNR